MTAAPVNKIIPFSMVDGPGNRSAVFLQGCDFNCRYCHNPETINMCAGCGVCVSNCPAGALKATEDKVIWDADKCCGCDACIKVCPNGSSPRTRMLTASQVMEEITPSLSFIQGITTSGGECTRHERFLTELFSAAHERGKTAFADTNGQNDFRVMPELMRVMDKAMLDIKSADEEEHIMLTGRSFKPVLQNLEYLLEEDKLFEIRTVVVPELLDNTRTVDIASRIIGRVKGVRYKLIKFRTWGVRPELQKQQSPTDEEMERLLELAHKNGVEDVIII